MNVTDIYHIHHGGIIRTRDLKAFAISHGLKWSSVLVSVSRWEKQGVLTRITRGTYLVSGIEVHAAVAACTIIPDSYISLEAAMAHHGMILDRTYRLDLACIRRVKGFRIQETDVVPHKIPERIYWGWTLQASVYGTIRVAPPEKALFDRIYLDASASPDYTYFEDLGLQPDTLNLENFTDIASCSPKVKRFVKPLKEYCHD